MDKKIFQAAIELKEGDEVLPGAFQAVFSSLNVIDLDGDITLPGAFADGQQVRIAYWGHRWHDLPVGKGVIHADDQKAWVDGQFFLDTDAGLETYKTVKNLAELQEWSYGFDINESENAVVEGTPVRLLKRLTVYEVSPVLLGAGIGTHTVAIKGTSQDKKDPVEDPQDESPEDGSDSEAADGGKESGLTPEVVLTDVEIGLQIYEVEK